MGMPTDSEVDLHGIDLHGGEGYTGPAQIVVGDASVELRVDLRGAFQPIDGKFHWYGRIDASPGLDALVKAGGTVTVRTAYGEASGRVCDRDPWDRLRLTGTGRPPFPV